MKSAIVLIGNNTTGTGTVAVRSIRAAGRRVIEFVKDPSKHLADATEGAELRVAEDLHGPGAAAACLALRADGVCVEGVTTFSDSCVHAAAVAAAAMGLPGPDPERTSTCMCKLSQRACLHDAGIPGPAWAEVDRDCLHLAERVGFPMVVKPTRGSGSVDVRLIQNQASLAEHIRASRGTRMMAEGYVEGPQYSVELFHGSTVGVTENHIGNPPTFVEVGHDFPARISPRVYSELASVAQAALVALGLTWGAAHVELRLSASGPQLIEVNPRLAGGMIPELVRRSMGVNLIECVLAAALGQPPDTRPKHDRACSLRAVIPPRAGTLAGVEIPAVSGCEFHQIRNVGDLAGGFGDFRDRVGYLIADADRISDSILAVDRALRESRVRLQEDAT